MKQNGLRAFQRNDFTAAIKDWSRVDRKAEPMVGPALAEAHFRRALNAADPNQRLADLMQAVELAPNEGRFWYHLGLAYHRAGRLEEARTAYGRAAATGFNRRPLIFARGLVEVEANPRVDAATLNAVTGGDTAALLPIAALLRREPQAVLAPAAANWFERLKGQIRGDAMAALWRGLALLATDRPADAATTLNARSGSPLSGDAEAVRAFYRGLALAAVGDQAAALAEWSALPERAGSPRLQAAGAAVHLGQVRAAWQAGRWAELLQAVESAFKLAGPSAGQPELIAAALVSHGRLAAEAAGRGAWAEAIPHWQQMVDLLDLVPALGPRGPIYHNLAIAYEATEQWEPAAAMWVLLMNALPRRQAKTKGKSGKSAEVDPKKSADAPADRVAAMPVAEKRAWLRRRILDCYKKAGRLDQAIAHYRAAVKAEPDDLDLRLELANALLANEQEVAGRNELRRILERDPAHQEARARLAELLQVRGELWEAERIWREAVDADPDYQPARRGLAELLRQRGHNQFELGRYAAARDIYAAAVQLTPDDAELLASIGYAELLLKNEAAARGHFEAALAQGTSEAYTEVFDRWAWNGNLNEARQVVARAEAMPVPMPHFYVNAASTVFAEMHPPAFEPFAAGPQKRMPAAIDSWEGLGKTLVEKAMATAGNRQDVYVHIITEIGPLRPELALPAAEKAAALMPDEPETWLSLALMQGITDRRREAKETLRRASLLTRKRGDMRLLSEIEELRRALDDPLFSMAAQLWPALDERDFEDL